MAELAEKETLEKLYVYFIEASCVNESERTGDQLSPLCIG